MLKKITVQDKVDSTLEYIAQEDDYQWIFRCILLNGPNKYDEALVYYSNIFNEWDQYTVAEMVYKIFKESNMHKSRFDFTFYNTGDKLNPLVYVTITLFSDENALFIEFRDRNNQYILKQSKIIFEGYGSALNKFLEYKQERNSLRVEKDNYLGWQLFFEGN